MKAGELAFLIRAATNAVPVGTMQIQLTLTMTRVNESYNNLSLVLARLLHSWRGGINGSQMDR